MKNGIQARGYNNLPCMVFDLQLFMHRMDKVAVAREAVLTFDTVGEQQFVGVPTYRWGYDTANAIFQELWNANYRPVDGSCGSQERDALKKHIDFAEHMSKALLDTNVHRSLK